jgi:glycosyltransferase involved in cell wall biosynthesis
MPGSGDAFYCGNCFRDNLQASALRKAGHDVIIMPLYLPLNYASFKADTPLFFPATTYYTAQLFFGKRKMPLWLKRITGSDRLLSMASSLSGATSAEGTEKMTLSMITGDDPAFDDQINQLVNWIKDREKPDIIHLSSSLLIGIAKVLRQHMTIPVVCSVQDEEVWIESLKTGYAGIAWQGIADNTEYISQFVTTSEFYKRKALGKIPAIKNIEVVYPGVNREQYATDSYPETPVIGFFYRMNKLNGIDIHAEAFVKIKRQNRIPNLRLKIGGGYTGKDKSFLKKVKKILEPYRHDVELCPDYNPDEHAAFYRSVSVISVPLTFEEGVGLYLCEAFAAGRPAVEPATGSFPEIVGEAGIIYQPNDSEALAEALANLLSDKDTYKKAAEQAKSLSEYRYNDTVMAGKLTQIYKSLINYGTAMSPEDETRYRELAETY